MGKSGNGEVVLHHRRQRRRVSDDEARQQTRLIRRECSRARSRETNAHHTCPSLIPGHFSHRDGRPFGRDHGERGIATPWLTRPATNREALPWNNFEPRRTGRPDGDQAASGVPAVLGSHRIDGCPEDDLTLTHRAGDRVRILRGFHFDTHPSSLERGSGQWVPLRLGRPPPADGTTPGTEQQCNQHDSYPPR